MTDTRITLTTSRNFARTVKANLDTSADMTDIIQAVAATGYTGHYLDLQREVLNRISSELTTEQLIARFVTAAEKALAKEAAAAQEAAKAQAAQAAKAASRYDGRILQPEATRPEIGATITVAGREATVTGYGKSFPIADHHPSLHGNHLLGHEGTYGAYTYYQFK